ncbi:MAG: glycosyltransferase family 39 protein [Planctomycetota bacterium]
MGCPRLSNRTTWIAFLALLGAFAFLAWREMSLVGITIDERTYIQAGRIILDRGWTHTVTRYHGPLPFYFNQLFGPPLPPGGLEVVADAREYIYWGRLGMLPFGLLAATVVFLWSRRAFGNLGGLLSAALFTTSPLMIGYSGLLAVEMAHTAAALLCCFLLWRFVQTPTAARCALAGLGLGIAFATKYLAVLLGPPVVVIAAGRAFQARWRGEEGTPARGLRAALGAALAITAISIVTLHASYGFRVGCASIDAGDYRSELLHGVMGLPIVDRLAGSLPAPFLLGMDYHLARADDLPFEPFLNGRYAPRHPTFYLWGFLRKTPEWILALTAWLLLLRIPFWLRGRGSFAERSSFWVAASMVVVVGGFLSLLTDQQLGVRYVLPLYGLLFVLLGAVTRASWLERLPRGGWIALGALVVLFHGWELWTNWPNLLSYYNQSTGGQAAAYRYFRESNSDWGQYGETGPALLQAGEPEPIEMLTALSGPRFGRVGIDLLALTQPDPEDRTRARHWLYPFAAVRHVGGAYWLFDVTPAEYERVVAQANDPRARAELAIAYLGANRFDDARRHLEFLPEERAKPLRAMVDLRAQSLAGPAGVPEMLALLGGLNHVGRFDAVEEIVRAHPDHPVRDDPRLSLLLATAAKGEGRVKEAIEILEKDGDPSSPPHAFLLASLYAEVMRFGEAIALLEGLLDAALGVDEERVEGMLAVLRADQRELESFRAALR